MTSGVAGLLPPSLAALLIAASHTVPAWLGLLGIPTLIGGFFGVLGNLYDGFGDTPPPAQFSSWKDVAQIVGFAIGAVIYPFALLGVYS